ncbi:MAG: hypothetical protein ACREKN_09075 [Longimicrobiaceae bacterium]
MLLELSEEGERLRRRIEADSLDEIGEVISRQPGGDPGHLSVWRLLRRKGTA